MLKKHRLTMTASDGTRETWRYWRETVCWVRSMRKPVMVTVWRLEAPDGCVRTLETTWRDSVPRIEAIAANHGLTVRVS